MTLAFLPLPWKRDRSWQVSRCIRCRTRTDLHVGGIRVHGCSLDCTMCAKFNTPDNTNNQSWLLFVPVCLIGRIRPKTAAVAAEPQQWGLRRACSTASTRGSQAATECATTVHIIHPPAAAVLASTPRMLLTALAA